MVPGLSGPLVSEYFAEEFLPVLFAGELGEAGRSEARSRLRRWLREDGRRLGPVSGARAVYDLAAEPVLRILGFQPSCVHAAPGGEMLVAAAWPGSAPSPLVLVTAWSSHLDSSWRNAVRHSLSEGARWCLATNGRQVRLIDTRRTYARRFVEFDLDCACEDEGTFDALWALLRRAGFDTDPALADRIADASWRHAAGVCRSLRQGVLDGLADLIGGFCGSGGRPRAVDDAGLERLHEQALTVVYRILFLLFAESRNLVPLWHPVYRRSYSLDSACRLAERPGAPRGLWATLQAISRLAHRGCRAGSLRVTPFNGRLFAPALTPLAECGRIDDETARRIVLALATAPSGRRGARVHVAYRDLGVEQLGAVYESLLDYRPRLVTARAERTSTPDAGRPRQGAAPARSTVVLVPGGGARKATGTFYTPRSITGYLVRRTLGPLVAGLPPERILDLRVVDPAMGSGAFLVAACRYMARAYEAAVVDHAGCGADDISDDDRRQFRRAIARRCLFGVDRNPMAVQLARLSLWLATLAPDRPLTFLDHHLQVGDSLVGASPDDLRRAPPGPGVPAGARRERDRSLPLFEAGEIGSAMRAALPTRTQVACTPDDTLAAVRDKEQLLAGLARASSPVARLKAAADLWCSFAFRPGGGRVPPGVFGELAGRVLRGTCALPEPVARAWLEEAGATADRGRFFHWAIEFPEVFYAPDGTPLDRPGFDAVIGNPPWDMIRGDRAGDEDRAEAKASAGRLMQFARTSGLYRAQGAGHGNLFQLFVERAHQLTREGGRLGLVVPWGLAADCGSAPLRRLLLDRCRMDGWIGFENTAAIFPIHRSVRFLVLTGTTGGLTEALPCRLGERDPAVLDRIPDLPGDEATGFPIILPRQLIARLSPDDAAIPDLRSVDDLELLERISSSVPPLGSREGWNVEFGRELNASDDREHMSGDPAGMPVLEGKDIEPFRATPRRNARRMPRTVAGRLLGRAPTFGLPRVAYRDVASATNRLTLISAIIPADCVTVHTLFCLKTALPLPAQQFLCGVLNSFVANYLVRQRVTTHLGAGIVSRLPVPRPPATAPVFSTVASLAAALARSPAPQQDDGYARLQAAVAHMYGLTRADLEHVLGTFLLIEDGIKARTMREF